ESAFNSNSSPQSPHLSFALQALLTNLLPGNRTTTPSVNSLTTAKKPSPPPSEKTSGPPSPASHSLPPKKRHHLPRHPNSSASKRFKNCANTASSTKPSGPSP